MPRDPMGGAPYFLEILPLLIKFSYYVSKSENHTSDFPAFSSYFLAFNSGIITLGNGTYATVGAIGLALSCMDPSNTNNLLPPLFDFYDVLIGSTYTAMQAGVHWKICSTQLKEIKAEEEATKDTVIDQSHNR